MKELLEEKECRVAAIENGSVIDHIPAGLGDKIIRLLHLHREKQTLLFGMRLFSKSMGRKDLIKIDKLELSLDHTHKIALYAPSSTINIIRNYKVVEKKKAVLPSLIEGILKCPNASCVSSHEKIKTKFHVKQLKEDIYLQCCYCSKDYLIDKVKEFSDDYS